MKITLIYYIYDYKQAANNLAAMITVSQTFNINLKYNGGKITQQSGK